MANSKEIDKLFNKGKNITKAVKSAVGTSGTNTGSNLVSNITKAGADLYSKIPAPIKTAGKWTGRSAAALGAIGTGLGTYVDIDKSKRLKRGDFDNANMYNPVDIKNSQTYYNLRAYPALVGEIAGAIGGSVLGGPIGAMVGSSALGTYSKWLTDKMTPKKVKERLINPYDTDNTPVEINTGIVYNPNKNKNSKSATSRYIYGDPMRGYNGGNSEGFINNLVAAKGLNADGQQQDNIEEQLQEPEQQSIAINGILDYLQQRKDKMQPYIDSLNEFTSNYGDMQKQYANLDRYYTGLAGWSGNQAWADYAKRHNPVETEATQIDLYRKLAEQELAEEDKYRQILGNIAVAESIGLRPEAALADPKMISNNIQMQKLQQTLQVRREIANLNAHIKDLDRQARVAMKQGDWENAQILRDAMDRASMKRQIVESAAMAQDPSAIAGALQALGYDSDFFDASKMPVSSIASMFGDK